jgi:hypothetical protein
MVSKRFDHVVKVERRAGVNIDHRDSIVNIKTAKPGIRTIVRVASTPRKAKPRNGSRENNLSGAKVLFFLISHLFLSRI